MSDNLESLHAIVSDLSTAVQALDASLRTLIDRVEHADQVLEPFVARALEVEEAVMRIDQRCEAMKRKF